MKFRILLLIAGLLPVCLMAQSGRARRAWDNLREGNHEKARDLLEKAIAKDEFDPYTAFVWSKLYIDDRYIKSNIDSAYYYILYARNQYRTLDERSVKKLSRAGIDSVTLEQQKLSIDNKAFNLAQGINSVDAYNAFIKKFPTSPDLTKAIELREAAAFRDATEADSEQAYLRFMEEYPEAQEYRQAKKRYEELFFVRNTSSGKLEDLKKYLNEKPGSDFRKEVETQILALQLIGNRLSDFNELNDLFRDGKVRKRLRDIYFHWFLEAHSENEIGQKWINDSLQVILNRQKEPMLPIINKGYFNYVNQKGDTLFKDNFIRIHEHSLCDFSARDLFLQVLPEITVLRNSVDQVVYQGDFNSYRDLGYGIIDIEKDGKHAVLHKSGVLLTDFLYDDIQLVGRYFVQIKQNGKWGLISFTGQRVLRTNYDSISNIGSNIILKYSEKFAITSIRELKKTANGESPNFVFIYDEYEEWPQKRIWVSSGDQEGLIDNDGGFAIKLKEQQLELLYDGLMVTSDLGKFYLNDRLEVLITYFDEIEVSETFVSTRSDNFFKLTYPETEETIHADSLKLWGRYFALGFQENKAFIRVPGKSIELIPDFRLQLIKGEDLIEYLLVSETNRYRLINQEGKIIIEDNNAFSARALGEEYIVYKRNNKEYLYSAGGERLLKPGYDLISGYENGGVSLLNDGKLGFFHLEDDLYIPADYSKKIRRGLEGQLILNEEGALYITNPVLEIESEERFEEIQVWNDEKYLVKLDGHYYFYDLKHGIGEAISFSEIQPSGQKNYFEIKNSAGKGLIHSTKGIILPPEYTFIEFRNNFIIAEKYISSADYYMKAYFDMDGIRIWVGGLSPDEYNKLYCDE